MKIKLGTKFQITKGYGKRILTVTAISTAPEGFDCHDQNGDLHFFSQGSLDVHEKVGTLRIISRKLTLARAAMESAHVQTVEVSLEEESELGRYYSAISNDSGFTHNYTVRLWEDFDGIRNGSCNCLAGAKHILCRHLIKAAEMDSEKYGTEIYTPTVEKYKAHLRRAA